MNVASQTVFYPQKTTKFSSKSRSWRWESGLIQIADRLMVVHSFHLLKLYGYGSIPINTIFSGMNIHLPAILMFTRGTIGFDTLPYSAISSLWHSCSLPIFRNGASNYSMLQKLQKGHNFIIFFSILPEFSAGLLVQSVRCRRRLSKISSVLRLLQSDGF